MDFIAGEEMHTTGWARLPPTLSFTAGDEMHTTGWAAHAWRASWRKAIVRVISHVSARISSAYRLTREQAARATNASNQ